MKKVFLLATAVILASGVSFADNGKKKKCTKSCCSKSGKSCGKDWQRLQGILQGGRREFGNFGGHAVPEIHSSLRAESGQVYQAILQSVCWVPVEPNQDFPFPHRRGS